MSALSVGEPVMFADDGGHFRKGSVWSLHENGDTYWIVCEGRMFARARDDLNSARPSYRQLELA